MGSDRAGVELDHGAVGAGEVDEQFAVSLTGGPGSPTVLRVIPLRPDGPDHMIRRRVGRATLLSMSGSIHMGGYGGEQRWVHRDGQRLCPVLVATSFADRSRGLLGRDGLQGALLLRPATSVHTFGMRFALDVAFLDRAGRVLRVVAMPRNRLGRPVLRAKAILEAEAGSFARWGLRPGDLLTVA